jgi:acyl carrier protein
MKKTLKKFQRTFAKNFFVSPDSVDFSKSFQRDFGLNESEFVAMIAHTENAFHIQIADNDIPKLMLVRDIVKYINKQTN